MSQAQEVPALPAAPSAVTALSGAEVSGAASHSSEGNGQHSFGGQVSPRAARSQISTAVSFEGARAAGSAALPSRSLEEESALSAAEGDVECSHSAEPNQAAPTSIRPIRAGRLLRPSNSLISTAVQPASPQGHTTQPVSPKLNRANSVVSHTAHGGRPHGGRPHGGRAGTPASVYGQGQGFLMPSRARQQSPAQPTGLDQVNQQAAAAAAVGNPQQGVLQTPPAWQQMPPAFPGLQDLSAQQQNLQPSLEFGQQHGMHRMEQRGSFDGQHRSSDNGGCRQRVTQHRGERQQQMQQPASAAGVAINIAAGNALAPAGMEQQLQPNMQLFHNALAALPTAVASGLLQGLLGQPGMGTGTMGAPGYGSTAAANASGVAGFAGQQAAGNGNSTPPVSMSQPAAPSDLLQQLQVQMTPALLAVLQGQASNSHPAVQQQLPGLPYTPQQLQQALSLLLAGLASQAGQFGVVLGGNGVAAGQQHTHGPAAVAGMRPPAAPAQARSCDSSIQGVPPVRQGGPAAAAAGALGGFPPVPGPHAHGMPQAAAAAAAGHVGANAAMAGLGVQQQGLGSWPQQQPSQPFQRPAQLHWRSPSPSPAPVGHAAARTSAAGEGRGSLNPGGPAYFSAYPLSDAANGAISSAGGGSRAGAGLVSEEGEADAPAPEGMGPADDVGQQGSIGDAVQEDNGSLPQHGDGHANHQAATSPIRRQQQQHGSAHAADAITLGDALAEHHLEQGQQQHAHQQQLQQLSSLEGDPVHPAASVHATMMSEGNGTGNSSAADSEQSSSHSGGSNSNMGGAELGHEAEIVSQLCGASHSASPPRSASVPAAATATGPASRSAGVGSGRAADSGAEAAREAGAGPAAAAQQIIHQKQQQHRPDRPTTQRSSQQRQESRQDEERDQEQQHNHRDSSLAMATAGPLRSNATVSTNSGTVDMSIHNESHRSAAGSQGEVPATGGWTADNADDEMQGATNSRDGEARGEPPGAFETAESGRAGEDGYQPPLHHAHEHHQHLPMASPVPGYSAAGAGLAAALSPADVGVASAHDNHGAYNVAATAAAAGATTSPHHEQRQQAQHSVRFATASAQGDAQGSALIGSPSIPGAYSSSDIGIPGVSAAGPVAAAPRRVSSAAGNVPGSAPGSDHGTSAADEVDAGSVLLGNAAAVAAGQGLQGDNQQLMQLGSVPGEPAAAQHITQEPLCATFSVTSQLQPAVNQHAAAAAQQHIVQHQPRHRQHPQQQHPAGRGGGSYMGNNIFNAALGSAFTSASQAQGNHQGHAAPTADAVPQVTEIHGHFADHSVPATAAAAQMAAAAAGQHMHVHPDVHPQVTEMHGVLGASAGTAAEAQLGAAAVGHGFGHAANSAAAAAGAGATGSTLGDGRLPPLPHMHSGRGYTTQHRPHFAAAGSSRVGAGANHAHSQGVGLNASPPAALGHQGGLINTWNSNQMHPPRSASAEAPAAAVHSRAHYSPPAVNFSPRAQAAAAAAAGRASSGSSVLEGMVNIMPLAAVPTPVGQHGQQTGLAPSSPAAAVAAGETGAGAPAPAAAMHANGSLAAGGQQESDHQQCPGSPSHAHTQGNSQLGQHDGSRGSPPVGMGRVGSVPPQEPVAAAAAVNGGGEVVEQQAPQSRQALSEEAGSHHHQPADDDQQQQPAEQEADGPSHATNAAHKQQQQQRQADSKSAVTSPSQRQRRHLNGFNTAATSAAAGEGAQLQGEPSQQLQQHWQQLQGAFQEGAGQVGGRAASMRFSYGQPEGSMAAGISSKIYGSVSAGFASGSKAEGGPSYGAGLDGCSCGNAMASGADGCHAGYGQQEDDEMDNHQQAQSQQQQAHSNTTKRRARSIDCPAAAAAALHEGEGSHGSRSQEVRSCKRQRTSCEAASVQQQQQHPTSSLQTAEA